MRKGLLIEKADGFCHGRLKEAAVWRMGKAMGRKGLAQVEEVILVKDSEFQKSYHTGHDLLLILKTYVVASQGPTVVRRVEMEAKGENAPYHRVVKSGIRTESATK